MRTAWNQVLHSLHVRFKSRNVRTRLIDCKLLIFDFFLWDGFMFTTIAHWFFSTPALIVAVSTRLEPRGGSSRPSVSYHKAVLQGRGLYPIIFGHFIIKPHKNFLKGLTLLCAR
jgi:hypothetical protein